MLLQLRPQRNPSRIVLGETVSASEEPVSILETQRLLNSLRLVRLSALQHFEPSLRRARQGGDRAAWAEQRAARAAL